MIVFIVFYFTDAGLFSGYLAELLRFLCVGYFGSEMKNFFCISIVSVYFLWGSISGKTICTAILFYCAVQQFIVRCNIQQRLMIWYQLTVYC